jgi:DNA-binding transcriptional LysR family regulator
MALHRRLLPSTSAMLAFEAVARTKSFTQAAADLGLTQGAVSRQVRALERLLRSPLVNRTAPQCSLTPVGAAYVEQVRQALTKIANATRAAIHGPRANGLRLAVHPAFGSRWLMPRVGGYLAQHRDVEVKFVTRYRQPFDFDADDIDAAIYFCTADDRELVYDYLFRDEVLPVCAPAFLAGRVVCKPRDLLHLPLLHEATRPHAWPDWFAANGVKVGPLDGMELEHFSLVTHAALSGLGIGLIPLFLIEAEVARRELVVALKRPLLSKEAYYLAYPKGKAGHRPLVAFRRWLLESAGAHPDPAKRANAQKA